MTQKRLYESPAAQCIALETQGMLAQSKNAQSIERGKLVDFDFDDPLSTDNEK